MPKRSKRKRTKLEPRKKSSSNKLRELGKWTSVSEERLFMWNLTEADFGGQWSMAELDLQNFCTCIWRRIHRFNGMKWGEIMGKNYFHFISVDRVVKDARKRFEILYKKEPELGEKLFSTEVSNKGRIWSIQRGCEGCIIWYDPEHTVYPTEMKNT